MSWTSRNSYFNVQKNNQRAQPAEQRGISRVLCAPFCIPRKHSSWSKSRSSSNSRRVAVWRWLRVGLAQYRSDCWTDGPNSIHGFLIDFWRRKPYRKIINNNNRQMITINSAMCPSTADTKTACEARHATPRTSHMIVRHWRLNFHKIQMLISHIVTFRLECNMGFCVVVLRGACIVDGAMPSKTIWNKSFITASDAVFHR